LKNDINEKRINVIKELGNIPKIECYAGKLNQVLMNILNNAIYAVSDMKEKGTITITTLEETSHIILKIRDNGIGIPEEIKTKIFEPFFTTKDVGQGVGLGLSIVYNIIETHHGEINVTSRPEQGTEFIITLPKVQKK
jgi:two-component system, NtrC family, sensor kinase